MKLKILAVQVLLIGLGGISLGHCETPEVSTPDGLIIGNVLRSRDGRAYESFKGIRYATIPGRFESSRPVEPWSEPLEATEFGPKCPQIGLVDGAIDVGDEDCLFLNVYVPKVESRGLLPVMVWIHGGGFLDGAGSNMGPDYFMDEDVILVTINYRLGAFGFLSTADDIVQGNNGLRDMVNALKWVQRNVQSFGGDRGKVTIFGESAGGASVHLLMLSPAAKGLFQGVISQSGNALCPWALNTSPVKYARMLGAGTNCPNSNSRELVDCLRGKTPKEILEGMQRVMVNAQGSTILAFSPTIEFQPSKLADDFPIITDTPYNLLTKDDIFNSRDVPLIIGLNEMEGIALFAAQFVSSEEQLDKLDGNWVQLTSIPFNYEYFVPKEKKDKFGETIREYYFGDEPLSSENINSLINLHTEYFFFRGLKLSTELHANVGSEVYPYVLNYRGDFSLARFIGVTGEGPTHADDLQYLFKSLKEPQNWPNVKNGTEDEKFSKKMVKLWASYAIHGEPVASWGETWTAAEAGPPGSVEHSWLSLDNEAKMVKNEAILARINKLDYLYSEYELPQVSWRTKKDSPVKKDEL